MGPCSIIRLGSISQTISATTRLSTHHLKCLSPALRQQRFQLFSGSSKAQSLATASAAHSSPTDHHHHNIPIPLTTTTTTTTTTTMAATKTFMDLVASRRTYYVLNKDLPISKERITELVKQATHHVPSSFNAQPVRVAVLYGAEHEKLWDITSDVLKAMLPADKFEPTAQKLAGFKAAAGSVLVFEHEETVKGQQTAFPLYADRFPAWAAQSAGMLEYILWTALEAEGLGANLQHYNPIIDEKVAAEWKIPAGWKLNAQLVFGGRGAEAGDKTFLPIDDLVKVFGQ